MSDEIKVKVSDKKRPSLMIATPMYGGMCTGHYVQGLLMTTQKMREVGAPVAWCQIMNESLITRARNELVRVFLETNHDYLMFIDADIGFDGEAILQLMAADKDVACGIYPKKEVNWDSVKRAALAGCLLLPLIHETFCVLPKWACTYQPTFVVLMELHCA